MSAPYRPSSEEQEEFDERFVVATAEETKVKPVMVNGQKVIWKPQNGSQQRFMKSPVFESLFHGTRGPGKTDALLMTFAQHVGKGLGSAWRGIIFRQTYPQLADVQAKSEKWFRQMFGKGAKFNRSKMQWEWVTGEVLLLRHMNRQSDYWNYHGHEYPFIGWEELCNWASDDCYTSMFACCRSSTPGVPKMVRATTNPYGPGHNWVKDRFELHSHWWRSKTIPGRIDAHGIIEPERCAIHGHIDENKILLAADPNYKSAIVASANNPAMAEAWLNGSWEIVAGGMFDDAWTAKYNVVPTFVIPRTWRVDRSFDWGSSAPFSVGWWAQSDGDDLRLPDGQFMSTVRGDLFRVQEWYGWTGRPNQGLTMLASDIAKGIIEREIMWGWRTTQGTIVKAGPADNAIHNVENGVCIARDMGQPIRVGNDIYKGVQWTRADKSPGSRVAGWEMVRGMMTAAHPKDGKPREKPGLFCTNDCKQFLRTVPAMPRDEKNMDDINTAAEDHIADEVRYRVRASGTKIGSGRHVGMY